MTGTTLRFKYENDGKCCHKIFNRCKAIDTLDEYCGDYRCPFYKPEGCEDWIRKDGRIVVEMIPPEEYQNE